MPHSILWDIKGKYTCVRCGGRRFGRKGHCQKCGRQKTKLAKKLAKIYRERRLAEAQA